MTHLGFFCSLLESLRGHLCWGQGAVKNAQNWPPGETFGPCGNRTRDLSLKAGAASQALPSGVAASNSTDRCESAIQQAMHMCSGRDASLPELLAIARQ